MSEVVVEVLPLALAIALSPFTIIPAILLLLTPRAGATSGAFLAGWLLALAVTATVFTLVAAFIELYEGSPAWASWARIALGAVLVVMGIQKWLERAKPKPPPPWMATISTLTPVRAFRFAVILAVANPKVLLLTAAAGLSIGAAETTRGEAAVAVAVFTVVAAASVAVPVVLYLVLGQRMIGPLTSSRDWLQRHNSTVMSIVFVLIGLALLAKGITDLT